MLIGGYNSAGQRAWGPFVVAPSSREGFLHRGSLSGRLPFLESVAPLEATGIIKIVYVSSEVEFKDV